MYSTQQQQELIPTHDLPPSDTRAHKSVTRTKKIVRAVLWSLGGLIVLAVAFFLLFVKQRPAPIEELRILQGSSNPVLDSAAQQKQSVDALSTQSKPTVPASDARALLQQLGKK